MTTPTPETDAAQFAHHYSSSGWTETSWVVNSDFARKLERERDEARKSHHYSALCEATDELTQLRKVCDELAAALRKDTVASFAIANSKPDAATICKQADDMHVTALTNYSTLPHVKAKE